MNPLANNKGIALVTALMLTLISLTIVMYLLYMVTSSVRMSGANKRYKSALEASYGNTDLVMKEIMPTLFTSTIASGLTNPTASLSGLYASSLNFTTSTDACLIEKLTKPSSQWTCSKTTDAKVSPDFTLQLNSTGSDPFTVFTKIVETVCGDKRPYPTGKCTGSDLSGIDYLDGGQGATGGSIGVSVKSVPAVYRIEVRGERLNNPQEKSVLSILYAY
jgi:Tfp pilus assembly protein PilX